MEEIRLKLDKALQTDDISHGLVQSIHDAARSIELAFLEHDKSTKDSWFSKAWIGVDNTAWIKSLSYQVEYVLLLLLRTFWLSIIHAIMINVTDGEWAAVGFLFLLLLFSFFNMCEERDL
jgi:hypothetical protein